LGIKTTSGHNLIGSPILFKKHTDGNSDELHKVYELGYVWEMLAPMILLYWDIAGWQLWLSKESFSLGPPRFFGVRDLGRWKSQGVSLRNDLWVVTVVGRIVGSACLSICFICELSDCIG
jgi:hypothetical protein